MGRGRKRLETREPEALKQAANAAAQQGDDPIARMVDLAIGESTLSQYRARIETMEEFFDVMDLSINESSFIIFLASLMETEGGGTSTAQGYKSAALHWQCRGSWPGDWSTSARIAKAVEGYHYLGGRGKKVKKLRGTLTMEMFKEVLKRIKKPGITLAAKIQGFLALRISELINILKGDWVQREDGTWWIIIRRNKRLNSKSKTQRETYWKRIHFLEVVEALELAGKNKSRGDEVFPPPSKGGLWNMATYRAELKEVTKEYAEGIVVYDGTHVLRHFGVGAIIQDAEEKNIDTEKYLFDTTQMSPQMQRWYGRTVGQRKGDPLVIANGKVGGGHAMEERVINSQLGKRKRSASMSEENIAESLRKNTEELKQLLSDEVRGKAGRGEDFFREPLIVNKLESATEELKKLMQGMK